MARMWGRYQPRMKGGGAPVYYKVSIFVVSNVQYFAIETPTFLHKQCHIGVCTRTFA